MCIFPGPSLWSGLWLWPFIIVIILVGPLVGRLVLDPLAVYTLSTVYTYMRLKCDGKLTALKSNGYSLSIESKWELLVHCTSLFLFSWDHIQTAKGTKVGTRENLNFSLTTKNGFSTIHSTQPPTRTQLLSLLKLDLTTWWLRMNKRVVDNKMYAIVLWIVNNK